jgi:hypothetical protein
VPPICMARRVASRQPVRIQKWLFCALRLPRVRALRSPAGGRLRPTGKVRPLPQPVPDLAPILPRLAGPAPDDLRCEGRSWPAWVLTGLTSAGRASYGTFQCRPGRREHGGRLALTTG